MRGSGATALVEACVQPRDGPGQQLGDAADRMVRDGAEHVAQVGLRIEPVQLGGLEAAIAAQFLVA